MIRTWLAALAAAALTIAAGYAQDASEAGAVIAPAITDANARALLDAAEASDMEADPAAALAAWTAAFEAARTAAPDETLGLAQIRNQLGAAHFYAGEREAALGHFQAAAEAFAGAEAFAENRQEALGNVGSILAQLGRFAEAEAAQREAFEIRRTLYPEAHPQIARSYFELGALANQQGRAEEAARLVGRALELRLETLGADHPHSAMTRVSLASTLTAAQRHDEAITEARAGLETLEAILPAGHPFIGFAKSNYAGALNAAGRHREAEPFLRQILDERRAQLGPDHPQVANSLNNLAVALGALGRQGEARTLFLAARDIYLAAEGEDSPTAARMQANAADFAGPDQLTERLAALAAFDRIGIDDGEDRMRLLSRVAISLANAGPLDEAVTRITQAQALAPGLFPDGHEARLALIIDEAWIRAADPDQQAQALALAAPAARALIDANVLDVDRSRDAAVRRDAARRRALDVAYAAGDADLIIALLDAGGPGGLSLSLAAASARSGADAEALRARQDAARRARAAETRYIRLSAGGAEAAAIEAASQSWDEARAALAEADAALPSGLGGAAAHPSFAAIQAGLAPHEAMLAFAFTERGGVTTAISRAGMTLDRLTLSEAEAGGHVAAIRAALTAGAGAFRSGGGAAETLSAFPAGDAHALYRGVFTADIEAATREARTLIIQPDGPYASLPFSVLITEPAPDTLVRHDELREAPWLARRQATVQAARLTQPVQQRSVARTAAARLFAAGAPAFTGGLETTDLAAVLRGAGVDTDALITLPPLPGARSELDRLAARFGAERTTLITGDAATEDAVLRGGMEEADIVVLATHGLLPGELEGLDEPALAFLPPGEGRGAATDGLLTASEIATLRLRAEWVVLSACNTFTDGRATPADRLAEAFLYAGAQSLLVSHWAVRDDVAAEITTAVAAGAPALGRAEAHRQAVLAVMDDPSIRGGAHPGVWAPFALIGR